MVEPADRTEDSPDLSVRSGPRKTAKIIFPLTRLLIFGFRIPERFQWVSVFRVFHRLVHLGPKRRFYPEGRVNGYVTQATWVLSVRVSDTQLSRMPLMGSVESAR